MSDFIVPAIAPRIRHLANGPEEARRVFTFPFPAASSGDIAVYRDGVLLDGGFAIAFAEDRQGGTVHFDAAVVEGAEIVILRATAIERATDFVENGAFRASTLNLELDRLTMIAQELNLAGQAGLHRALSEIGPDLVLPAPLARANGLLGFSADGQALAILPVESLRGEKGDTGPQGVAGDMSGANNLIELTDPAAARANLDVAGWDELNTELAAMDAAVRQVDLNLALNTMRDASEAGWTAFQMVDGFVDVFTDQSGVSIPYTDVTSEGSASASSIFNGSYVASNALTGTSNGWASNYGVSGSWWQITFPVSRSISRIDIAVSRNSLVSASLKPQYHDGSTWVDLADSTTTTAYEDTPYSFTFDPVEAMQFRLLYSAGTNGVAYLMRAWFYEGTASGLSSGQIYDAGGGFYTNNPGGYMDTLTPVMTSNIAPSGTAFASLEDHGSAYAAFDQNGNATYWQCSGSIAVLGYIFPTRQQVARYAVTSGLAGYTNRSPGAWTFEGSNNGTDWMMLHGVSSTSWSVNEVKAYDIASPGNYTHYRMKITAGTGGNFLLIGEISTYAVNPVNAIALISNPVMIGAPPVSARAVLLAQALEGADLRTDLICEISRDDGVTWSAGELQRLNVFETGYELLELGEVDLEDQPAGTAMRIRLRTDVSVRVKGWVLQWR